MKKILLTIATVCFSAGLMASGLVTNTNQSAAWTRMMARDATLDADAVYYNPAGTVFMEPGLHLSVSNQTITQTRWINTNYPGLNDATGGTREFVGDVFAPAFPSIYGVFNTGKFAISAAFNPIGGGGGAEFSEGLPRIEYSPALIAASLAPAGVTGYEIDTKFEASSIYFGYQINVAYKVNDMLSVAVGGRLVTAKNTYNGYLTGVNMNFMGSMTPVASVFGALADSFEAIAGTGPTLQPIIDGGAGGFTLQQLVDNAVIDATTRAQLEAGLGVIGIPDPSALTLTQIQGAFDAAAPTMLVEAATMDAKGTLYGSLMDQEADVLQTATGFAPIFSINFSPIEMLNIAVKYEGKTSLKFKNETTSDFTTGIDPGTGQPITMFPNGKEYNADMPAQISVGVNFNPISKLLISAGMNTYLDKKIDYSQGLNAELIDKNYLSYSLGVEYGLSDALAISAGYGASKSGVNSLYQSDITHSLSTSSFGGGFKYSIGSLVDINLGAAFTSYAEESYTKTQFSPEDGVTPLFDYVESYDRGVWMIAVGADFHF